MPKKTGLMMAADCVSTPLVSIQGKNLGPEQAPWIIAEMSANHNGSLERALQIIEAAASSGADAVKLQTYTAQGMTLNTIQKGFIIDQPQSLWYGRSLYNLYEEAQTPWGWHKILLDHCKKLNLIGFSSPFDEQAVELLESLSVPCYKIASLEINDYRLLDCVASTKKPVFISTGTSSFQEVEEAIERLKKNGSGQVIVLKCTSAYPTPYEEANLRTLEHLKKYFGPLVGLSDHTLGTATSIAAVALGACAIEKHFTLARSDGGVDSAFSLEPSELRSLCEESKKVWRSVGQVHYGPNSSEKPSLALRRSLYITQDVQAQESVSVSNVRSIRPGGGMSPRSWEQIQGRKFCQSLPAGTPLSWELLEALPMQVPKPLAAPIRIVAVVQARMGSTRLKGKVLMPLAGKAVLEHVIERLKRSKHLSHIVIATTTFQEDDPIESLALSHAVGCVRGSSEDVLSRYVLAANNYQAHAVVRVTSDCPLIDADVVDGIITRYLESYHSCDYISNTIERTFPRGLDVELFSYQMLIDLHERSKTACEREHVSLHIHREINRYACLNYQQAQDLSFHRWTVDTSLDYAYLDAIFAELYLKDPLFGTKQVLEWVRQNPQWAFINSLVKQKKP